MPTISPQRPFPLAYLIGDTSDANTYYAQAIIRNTLTGAILSTTNLTQDPNNSRRFTGAPVAPADTSGLGLSIDVTVTVYTNAGYTVKSALYPEQVFMYIVQDRGNSATNISAGGGGDSDSDERLLKEVRDLRKDLKKLTGKKQTTYSDNAVRTLITEKAQEIIDAIPEHKETDLEPTNTLVRELAKMVKGLPEPDKFVPTDLTGLEQQLSGLSELMERMRSAVEKLPALEMVLGKSISTLEKAATGIKEEIANTTFNLTLKKGDTPEKKPEDQKKKFNEADLENLFA